MIATKPRLFPMIFPSISHLHAKNCRHTYMSQRELGNWLHQQEVHKLWSLMFPGSEDQTFSTRWPCLGSWNRSLYTVYIEMITHYRITGYNLYMYYLLIVPAIFFGKSQGVPLVPWPRSPYNEANTDFLPHSWCWRHKIVLVACVCVAALASSGFMIYAAWHVGDVAISTMQKRTDGWTERKADRYVVNGCRYTHL